mmetsp:Transcript_3509/g.5334  ORF Transcript_3509/g.5334 Transcript_3509/m.5334 type:complete len:190 (-) Transcript_3509:491-1060(-)|eukprot:CAMPEP_0184672232 /NCGR_PEP_ID=MMETSP0308-20130426/85980_1 /TAXON_ID=38269 /ORGANISM="Gloeochaete witrockiana, Strain SAG 46.84" /LENGTH=189 /DNA_ID=CAMNT_0027119525 /DNA_START=158 /DNA_END=727 /DNA_ORIENTATION=+
MKESSVLAAVRPPLRALHSYKGIQTPVLVVSDPAGSSREFGAAEIEDMIRNAPNTRSRLLGRYRPGRSQLDWRTKVESTKNLAGNGGISRNITMDEVRRHNTEADAWVVLKGKVYNITPYLAFHPGGREILANSAGKDVTSLFNKYHIWVNSESLIGCLLLGDLSDEGDLEHPQQVEGQQQLIGQQQVV